MEFSRRTFIKTAGAGAIAAGIPAFASDSSSATPSGSKASFRFAIAGYTFYNLGLGQSLEMMKRLNVNLMGVKDIHLPLDSSQEVIDQTLLKMRSYGVEPYGIGPVYMKSEAEVDQTFTYAKMVGVSLLVGVPDIPLLPYVEKKVKEYNIRVAIHNHGPDYPLYQGAIDIWKEISNLDPRIGFCLDIAHSVRLGQDPIKDFLRYKERIFDFHIWDVDKPDKAGRCIEAGRGIIDFPKFFRTIIKEKYTGTCSLEYSKDMKDPLPGIAESMGYFHGVLAGL